MLAGDLRSLLCLQFKGPQYFTKKYSPQVRLRFQVSLSKIQCSKRDPEYSSRESAFHDVRISYTRNVVPGYIFIINCTLATLRITVESLWIVTSIAVSNTKCWMQPRCNMLSHSDLEREFRGKWRQDSASECNVISVCNLLKCNNVVYVRLLV